MTYTITILRRALKELSDLPQNSYTRVRDEKKLASRSGWRIRVGSYRVVYEIDDASRLITIMHVGHRRDIYR